MLSKYYSALIDLTKFKKKQSNSLKNPYFFTFFSIYRLIISIKRIKCGKFHSIQEKST